MTELTPDLLPTNVQQDTGVSASHLQTSSEMPLSDTSTVETINNAPQTGHQAELPQSNLTEASEPQNQPAIANESDQQQLPDESNQQSLQIYQTNLQPQSQVRRCTILCHRWISINFGRYWVFHLLKLFRKCYFSLLTLVLHFFYTRM